MNLLQTITGSKETVHELTTKQLSEDQTDE